MTHQYGPVEEADLDAYARLLNRCFGVSSDLEQSRKWLADQDRANLRTLREDGRPIAALSLLDMGQFFGGRPVRSAGVAGVGIEPDRRGRGGAKVLMTRFLEECRELGYPLSTLYASTYAPYRGVGYERAGARWLARVRPRELRGEGSDVELDAATPDDEPAMEALWREWAAIHSGQLDRGPYHWMRVRSPRRTDTHACVVRGEGPRVDGYVRWLQVETEGAPYRLAVTDVAARTPDAARRILALFADHSSLASQVTWATGPGDPLLALLPERYFELELADEWLVRLVDARAALEARGYPLGVDTEVHFVLEDALLPWNSGHFVLRVAEGRGEVRPGGDGDLRVGPRGLAPLYTGHRSPAQLALAGMVSGDRAALERAAAVFAGPSPWMADMF